MAKRAGGGFIGSLSPHQEQSLLSMREQLGRSENVADGVLLRFLRARDFDVGGALKQFQSMQIWRAAYGCDQILANWSLASVLDEEGERQFRECYQTGYHRTDRWGRPVLIDRIGSADFETLKILLDEDDFLRWRVYGWEQLLAVRFPACSRVAGHKIETSVAIVDLQGLSMTAVWDKSNMDLLKKALKLDNDRYPEMLHQMFIINAPWAFRGAWNIIKSFLSPRTVEKIMILGTDYHSALQACIAPENLPTFLGGQCECEGGCSVRQPGPWDGSQDGIQGHSANSASLDPMRRSSQAQRSLALSREPSLQYINFTVLLRHCGWQRAEVLATLQADVAVLHASLQSIDDTEAMLELCTTLSPWAIVQALDMLGVKVDQDEIVEVTAGDEATEDERESWRRVDSSEATPIVRKAMQAQPEGDQEQFVNRPQRQSSVSHGRGRSAPSDSVGEGEQLEISEGDSEDEEMRSERFTLDSPNQGRGGVADDPGEHMLEAQIAELQGTLERLRLVHDSPLGSALVEGHGVRILQGEIMALSHELQHLDCDVTMHQSRDVSMHELGLSLAPISPLLGGDTIPAARTSLSEANRKDSIMAWSQEHRSSASPSTLDPPQTNGDIPSCFRESCSVDSPEDNPLRRIARQRLSSQMSKGVSLYRTSSSEDWGGQQEGLQGGPAELQAHLQDLQATNAELQRRGGTRTFDDLHHSDHSLCPPSSSHCHGTCALHSPLPFPVTSPRAGPRLSCSQPLKHVAQREARASWQWHLQAWMWYMLRWGWVRWASKLLRGPFGVSQELDDKEQLSLLLSCSGGFGLFGLQSPSCEEKEMQHDASWWRSGSHTEKERNAMLEKAIQAAHSKLQSDKVRHEQKLMEEQVRHQRTMRRQYQFFTEQHQVEREEVEVLYRRIDELSSYLASAYMCVQQAEDEKQAGRLQLQRGSSGEILNRGLELTRLTKASDSVT